MFLRVHTGSGIRARCQRIAEPPPRGVHRRPESFDRARSTARSSAVRFAGWGEHRFDESLRLTGGLVGLHRLTQVGRDIHALHTRDTHVCGA